MNTEPGSAGNKQLSDFDKLELNVPRSKLDATTAILAERLQTEMDKRCEERFAWIFAAVLLIDGIAFPHIGYTSIAILVLGLIFLIFMAKFLGVDWVVVYLESALAYLKREKPKKD